jgi:Tfp pilus assembly protein FimV
MVHNQHLSEFHHNGPAKSKPPAGRGRTLKSDGIGHRLGSAASPASAGASRAAGSVPTGVKRPRNAAKAAAEAALKRAALLTQPPPALAAGGGGASTKPLRGAATAGGQQRPQTQRRAASAAPADAHDVIDLT